jgi:2-methylcitrate dehydratase PrpD
MLADTTPTNSLMAFVDTWRQRELPATVVARTKQVVLDTLACYVGGTALDAGRILLKHAALSRGDVTLFPLTAPIAEQAASFAACQIANTLDADDTLYFRAHHACAIVMASLITGAAHGKSITDVLRAIAIGYEVASRLALSIVYHTSGSDGSIRTTEVSGDSWITPGLSVALSVLKGLDSDKIKQAFNLACYMAPLPTNTHWVITYPPEAMIKYFSYGSASQAAQNATELAELGFVGPASVLEGPRGFRRMIGATEWRDDAITQGVPGTWTICETALKKYPACRAWNGAMYGIERLMTEQKFGEQDIEHVDVLVALMNPHHTMLATQRPQLTQMSAQFSPNFCCAQIIQRKVPGPSWYSKDNLNSEATRALIARIDVRTDPTIDREASAEIRRVGHLGFKLPWSVTIRLRSGASLVTKGNNAPGDGSVEEMIISFDETVAKFNEFYTQAFGNKPSTEVIKLLDHGDATCGSLLNALFH